MALLLIGLNSHVKAQSNGDEVSSWSISEIPRGLAGPPSEKFFISLVEPKRIDGMGGELLVHMTPAVNRACKQLFKVGWDFGRDISVVREGETINVSLFNEPLGGVHDGLHECYTQAKRQMAFGGYLRFEMKGSGGSHFLYQGRYQHYQQGYSQYLFTITKHPGVVFPVDPGFPAPVRGAVVTVLVKDGIYDIGGANAPRGNFSFSIGMGEVFTYSVAYLYDAITGPEAPPPQEPISPLTGLWTYAGDRGRAEIQHESDNVVMKLTIKPRMMPSPHYTIKAKLKGYTLEGTWEFNMTQLEGYDLRFKDKECRGGKFVAQVNPDRNIITVTSGTEDPCKHEWHGIVFHRKK
jgi:hypothetical protein